MNLHQRVRLEKRPLPGTPVPLVPPPTTFGNPSSPPSNKNNSSNGRCGLLLRFVAAGVIATAVVDMLSLHQRVLRDGSSRSTTAADVNSSSSSSSLESALSSYYSSTNFAQQIMTIHNGVSINDSTSSDNDAIGSTSTTTKIAAMEAPFASSMNISKTENIVKIAVFPMVELSQRKANFRHLIADGVELSPLLEFVDVDTTHQEEEDLMIALTEDDNVVWLLDYLAARDEWGSNWCDTFGDLLQHAIEIRKDLQKPTRWPIVIVDNRDYAYISYCPHIEAAVGSDNVLYSFRSLVTKRAWGKKKLWVRLGKTIDVKSQAPRAQYEHVHRPIGVRTDTVHAIQEQLQQTYGYKLCFDIEKLLPRSIDVSYFWESRNYTREDSFLRDKVYDMLIEFGENNPQFNVSVGLKGNSAMRGRKRVSNAYVDAILDSKIVVVAQRDYWEDHYRLFEAIAAGAMVLTDKMLSLPKGLQDGVSVVEYNSAEELIEKLEYYLEHPTERINAARRGRYVSMSRHRSWHHMEEMVFGAAKTICTYSYTNNNEASRKGRCPYMVNTKYMDEPCCNDCTEALSDRVYS